MYFFYTFIQQYTFYLLIFLWTDTKMMVNLELREKFTRWKKPEFHDNESENISGESALLCRCKTIYNVQSISMSLSPSSTCFYWLYGIPRISTAPGCGAYSRAALINFFVPDAALIRARRLIEGGAYSSKYGTYLSCLKSFFISLYVWDWQSAIFCVNVKKRLPVEHKSI